MHECLQQIMISPGTFYGVVMQMEKRSTAHISPDAQHRACRAVLQKGLQLNPQSTCLIQVGMHWLNFCDGLACLTLLFL
jgi:hypothetical protein